MASPVGHALIGLSAAAVVQQVTGTPHTALLWVGAFVASGVPDLDVFLRLVGRMGPKYHRNASHSFLVILGFWLAIVAVAFGMDLGLPWGVLLAWLAALLSHPVLDYLTTGPRLGEAGYGIALWWPISKRRYTSVRMWLAQDRGETHRAWDYFPQALEELVRLGPIALGAVLLARFFA